MASTEVRRRTTSKRPPDSDFYQQRLKAWQPILTPGYVTATFCGIGVIFVIVGILLYSVSDGVHELVYQYDGEGTPDAQKDCMLSKDDTSKKCQITITPEADMEPPVFIYYQLDNFYQNHRRYVKSRSDAQLRGDMLEEAALGDCDPMVQGPAGCGTEGKPECRTRSPCGLIAASFFNDVITSPDLKSFGWTEKGIAWASDKETKFKNPKDDPKLEKTDKYLYLPEMYPDFPWNDTEVGTGVENEHFIVWMRTAALPSFRKLYAKLTDKALEKGKKYHFEVDAHFKVASFKGKKSLVVSTTSWLGGKNDFLGIAYIVVGVICFVLGVLFLVRYKTSGRELGDPKYLNWRR